MNIRLLSKGSGWMASPALLAGARHTLLGDDSLVR
jgi:hypothetical protein